MEIAKRPLLILSFCLSSIFDSICSFNVFNDSPYTLSEDPVEGKNALIEKP